MHSLTRCSASIHKAASLSSSTCLLAACFLAVHFLFCTGGIAGGGPEDSLGLLHALELLVVGLVAIVGGKCLCSY